MEEVGTILKAVKGTVVKSFRSNPWMDEGTKKAAIRKSKKITALVGFPDYIKNQVLGSSVAYPDPGSGIGCLFDPWIQNP